MKPKTKDSKALSDKLEEVVARIDYLEKKTRSKLDYLLSEIQKLRKSGD